MSGLTSTMIWQPVDAAELDAGQPRPLVVRAAEEGDREHDEPEHETEVARLERRSEEQTQRSHARTGERDQRQDEDPVEMEDLSPGLAADHAMGRTMAAEMRPWAPPEITFDIATSQIGHGAWTRSSISWVKPNSWASCMATA